MDTLNRLKKFGCMQHFPDDPLFSHDDKQMTITRNRYYFEMDQFEEDEEEELGQPKFKCGVSGCSKTYSDAYSYDLHYRSSHYFVCNTCKKNLPTSYFLELHVEENHDSYFAVAAAKKPMYQCFVQHCLVKSSTPQERSEHAIKDHGYPHNFRFDEFSKGATNKHRTKVGSAVQMEVDGDENSSQKQSSGMVKKGSKVEGGKPFVFGQRSKKIFVPFQVRKKVEKESTSLNDFVEAMEEALPEAQ